MFDMFRNSVTLFLSGKLFKDAGKVFRQVLIGAAITAASCVLFIKLGLSLVIALTLGAVIGGALQPWLFKDLKYA